jgi:hypothetical protein
MLPIVSLTNKLKAKNITYMLASQFNGEDGVLAASLVYGFSDRCSC